MTENRELVISNLDQRVDRSLLGDKAPDRWRAIPYKTEGISGVMLGPGGSADIPPIEIALDVKGCYRIRIGFHSFLSLSRLRVRLSGDVCCETLPPAPHAENISFPVLHEAMWRETDLTGKNLIIEGGHLSEFYPAALAYIHLEYVETISVLPKVTIEYPMAITEDGFGIFHEMLHNHPRNLLEPLNEIPSNSCMKMLIWGAADGDNCLYPTQAGTYRGLAHEGLTRHADSTYYSNLRRWKENRWDPMTTVRDFCRIRGWEFHAYVRVEAFATQYPLTLTSGFQSEFFDANPDLHCRDREGRRVLRMS